MSVVIGYVHGNDTAASFTNSMVGLLIREMGPSGSGRLVAVLPEHSGVNISHARNTVVQRFLDLDAAEWLLMVDADMMFPPDVLERITADADPERAPIVGGLCFGTDAGRLFPTLYQFVQDESGSEPFRTVRYEQLPDEPAMLQVSATGAAFLLVHRGVLEAVRDKRFSRVFPWFAEQEIGSQRLGEDIVFCVRAGLCGYPIWVDTRVEIGHQKPVVLTADGFRAQRQEASA